MSGEMFTISFKLIIQRRAVKKCTQKSVDFVGRERSNIPFKDLKAIVMSIKLCTRTLGDIPVGPLTEATSFFVGVFEGSVSNKKGFKMTLKYALLAFCIVAKVSSYSTGPPPTICDDPSLKPGHNVDFQDSPSPYRLIAKKLGDSSAIGIRIVGKNGETFKGRLLFFTKQEFVSNIFFCTGFAIQGQLENSSVVGGFHVPANMNDYSTYKCGDSPNVNLVAHNNPDNKTSVNAIWEKPADLPANTNIVIRATVVLEKEKIWTLEKVIKM